VATTGSQPICCQSFRHIPCHQSSRFAVITSVYLFSDLFQDFPKHSLAALLEMFCDFTPDKRYQLADWRIRPLPDEMLVYARSDTHFLIYIYDHLRNALVAPRSPQAQSQHPTPLLDVLRRSADTALRTYVSETYDAIGGTGVGGWDSLSRKWNRSSGVGGDVQTAVFKAVHRWRDDVGRSEDESTRCVVFAMLPSSHS
jgi:exosome complex exonuclease RRP6